MKTFNAVEDANNSNGEEQANHKVRVHLAKEVLEDAIQKLKNIKAVEFTTLKSNLR